MTSPLLRFLAELSGMAGGDVQSFIQSHHIWIMVQGAAVFVTGALLRTLPAILGKIKLQVTFWRHKRPGLVVIADWTDEQASIWRTIGYESFGSFRHFPMRGIPDDAMLLDRLLEGYIPMGSIVLYVPNLGTANSDSLATYLGAKSRIVLYLQPTGASQAPALKTIAGSSDFCLGWLRGFAHRAGGQSQPPPIDIKLQLGQSSDTVHPEQQSASSG